MNKVILMGRLSRDPEVRYSQGDNPTAIGRYTLAVDRRRTSNSDDQTADFISCVAFGKAAEFVEKYCHKGTKLAITGRLQSGNYTNKEGQKVYTTEVVIEEQEFAESKSNGNSSASAPANASNTSKAANSSDGFMNIPDGIDEELPFH